MIIIKNLTKSYQGRAVLDGLNLELPGSGIVKIMGESGAGKTTLVHILAGLVKPDSGEVIFAGPHKVSMVFQEDRLLERDSALANASIASDSPSRDAGTILKELGLEAALDTKASKLSGGMARRVSIARALVREADIYIMDEPIKGLDETNAAGVIEVIKRYTEGHLLIVVSHDREEFKDADKIVDIM